MTFQFVTEEEPWPPPGYYAGGVFKSPAGTPIRIASPLEDRVTVAPDGSRHLSFQLPVLPVDLTHPVFVSGVIQANINDGTLVDNNGVVVGSINFTTGIFTLDIDKAPGPNTRFVEYFSNGKLIMQAPDADQADPLTFQG